MDIVDLNEAIEDVIALVRGELLKHAYRPDAARGGPVSGSRRIEFNCSSHAESDAQRDRGHD